MWLIFLVPMYYVAVSEIHWALGMIIYGSWLILFTAITGFFDWKIWKYTEAIADNAANYIEKL